MGKWEKPHPKTSSPLMRGAREVGESTRGVRPAPRASSFCSWETRLGHISVQDKGSPSLPAHHPPQTCLKDTSEHWDDAARMVVFWSENKASPKRAWPEDSGGTWLTKVL